MARTDSRVLSLVTRKEDDMDLKRLSGKAKDLVEKRGGSESLKRDADELKGIAKGPGSLKDKAKAAASAIKDPGKAGPDSAPAAEATTEERERAEQKVQGEERGKHAQGRDSDPAV
jgi:hypothetical protein